MLGDLLTFLNPVYLIGMASAVIPLLIHLSQSRRTKKMRFSTTRFFTDQFLRSYRMNRLKELLLLAFRMALFAVLAMALAQPLFMPSGATLPGGAGARAVVLVIDNSASMAYTEDGVTLLDRAKDGAPQVLDRLRGGDTAAVVLAGRRAAGPEALFAAPTDQLGDVLQAVNRLQPASLGTDLTRAVTRAEEMVKAVSAPNREVYVFSDLQDSGWEIPEDRTVAGDSGDVSFVFVRVRPRKPVSNVGVTAIQYASARPMVGVPFAIRPLLAIQGDDVQAPEVRLYVDGEKVGEQKAEKLQTGRWAVPRFHHTFATGGWHSGYVEVQDQTLAPDNRRYFALEVLDTIKILAVNGGSLLFFLGDKVNGAPSPVPRLDELFFLKLALTASPEGQKSPVEVDTRSPAELAGADLARYPLVVLANVERLSDAALEKLQDYAANGGSLLFFLGDKVNAAYYNDNLVGDNLRFGGLLPGRLVRVEGNAEPGEAVVISAVRYDHPALAAFQEPKFGTLLGPSVTFKSLWRVDADPGNVLMKASSGAPLLCEKEFGKGRVLLFTSTCDRDWTNFPIRPAFLPWTHHLVGYLAQGPLGPQVFHRTGEVVRLAPANAPAAGPVLVKKPGGAVASASVGEDDGGLVFTDTDQVGVYAVLSPEQKGSAGLFAVNLENYESDLTYLDDVLIRQAGESDSRTPGQKVEAGLKKLTDRAVVTYLDDPARLGEAGAAGRRGWKLWDYLLVVVLAIGLIEPWLANYISARHYSRAREAPRLAGPRGFAARTATTEPTESRNR